jgi:hypothetical protein
LSASLPAFGWFSSLQRGFVVWASTGVAPMTVAAMRLRVKGIRFILRDLLSE